MLDADKSHLDVTWVSQSLYSGPLSNPDFFLSLVAGQIRQVVLYNPCSKNKGADQLRICKCRISHIAAHISACPRLSSEHTVMADETPRMPRLNRVIGVHEYATLFVLLQCSSFFILYRIKQFY